MIRLIFALGFVVLFLIFSIPMMFIEWLIHKKNPHKADLHSMRMIRWAFRGVLFFSGVKLSVKGLDQIPKEQACLFVGNHNSFFDVISTYTLTQRPMGYVSKIEFKKVPLLNVWMKRIRCLFLDRSNIREGLKMVLEGVAQIKEGVDIFIFPEGTRSKDGQMLTFKEGALKIADKANCPIIPVAIKGSGEIFEQHLPFIRKGTIQITYGAPVYPDQLSKEEKKFLGAHVQHILQTMLDQSL